MSVNELIQEVEFGLENLEKVYQIIANIVTQKVNQELKTSALAYECMGYYNAIEHLIIRIFKHLRIKLPTGKFSHRDILKNFETLVDERKIEIDHEVVEIIENLMAFRHVATKIYGFLIDRNKLQSITEDIERNHKKIKQLILNVLATIEK
ncbi:MAG: hypothetical protein ACE5IW_01295 [bacterium]